MHAQLLPAGEADLAASEHDAGWPAEVRPILERAITCEFATLTKRGAPITYPLTPYPADDGRTLDVSTIAEATRRRAQLFLMR